MARGRWRTSRATRWATERAVDERGRDAHAGDGSARVLLSGRDMHDPHVADTLPQRERPRSTLRAGVGRLTRLCVSLAAVAACARGAGVASITLRRTTLLPQHAMGDASAPQDTSPAVASTPASTTAPCIATLRGGAHLRPRAAPQTVGPELAPGTNVEVLGVVPHVRRESARAPEDAALLAHVRVVGSAASGWVFVRPSELGETCPMRVEDEPPSRWSAPSPTLEQTCRQGPRMVTERGAFRLQNRPLRCGFGEWDRVLARVDANGDGQLDSLLHLSASANGCDRVSCGGNLQGITVLRWHTVEGWRAAELTVEGSCSGGNPDYKPSSEYAGIVRAGRAVYFRVDHTPSLSSNHCVDLPPSVHDGVENIALHRLHPCGELVTVLQLPALAAGGCTWTGLPDESVRVTCRHPARSLLLRWNAASFRLEPEGAALPRAGLDSLCLHEWEVEEQRRSRAQ